MIDCNVPVATRETCAGLGLESDFGGWSRVLQQFKARRDQLYILPPGFTDRTKGGHVDCVRNMDGLPVLIRGHSSSRRLIGDVMVLGVKPFPLMKRCQRGQTVTSQ